MTKQTDYIVNEISDSPDKTIYYYVHSPEFETEEDAEKLRQKIIDNQKIVDKVTQLYYQEDFEDADEAVTYLHFREKLVKALGKDPGKF